MLKELVERFESDPNRQELAKGTQGNYRPAFDVLGGETNVKHITRPDILRIRDTLCWLPPYYNKNPAYRGRPLEDLVAETRELRDIALQCLDEAGIEDPDPATLKEFWMPALLRKVVINKYLGGISKLFAWAVDEQIVPSTPAARIKFQKVEESTRRSFTTEELEKLFPKDYAFGPVSWIPVVLLYQGLRPNECCQLLVDDVIQDSRSGLHCLRITLRTLAAAFAVPPARD
ncbi:MAG: hypothetical protein AB1918_04700 [Pseudomonadota bacterium]